MNVYRPSSEEPPIDAEALLAAEVRALQHAYRMSQRQVRSLRVLLDEIERQHAAELRALRNALAASRAA